MENNFYPFVNLPLPYPYDALEPFIDAKTMELHHDRHLQTYIDNLNATLANHPELQKLSLEQLIWEAHQLPTELQTSIRNNAGGVFNHRFFFDELNPDPSSRKSDLSQLIYSITEDFGSLEKFKAAFKQAALSVFGSGYAWLVCDRCHLKIITTPNQNSPLEHYLYPLLTIDVWEHAYYLKHYNLRGDYIDDWMKIIFPSSDNY